MEFKTKIELQQLKKMIIGFSVFCQLKEKENTVFSGLRFKNERSLFLDMMNQEAERTINQIDNELKQLTQ